MSFDSFLRWYSILIVLFPILIQSVMEIGIIYFIPKSILQNIVIIHDNNEQQAKVQSISKLWSLRLRSPRQRTVFQQRPVTLHELACLRGALYPHPLTPAYHPFSTSLKRRPPLPPPRFIPHVRHRRALRPPQNAPGLGLFRDWLITSNTGSRCSGYSRPRNSRPRPGPGRGPRERRPERHALVHGGRPRRHGRAGRAVAAAQGRPQSRRG